MGWLSSEGTLLKLSMIMRAALTRRELLRTGRAVLLGSALPALLTGRLGAGSLSSSQSGGSQYQGTDEQLLDEIERAAFRFFWNEAGPASGQVKDRALAHGSDSHRMSSIAATGFGLAGLCIAEHRGYAGSADVAARVLQTLQFVLNQLPNEHGFYYHFVDMDTGKRWETCELSSIDTSILLCGVLTAKQHFSSPQIKNIAAKIYERVDWPWMLNGGSTFSMGWKPETGFLKSRWSHYCELMMIYLLAIGSPTHPVSADTWNSWSRPRISYQGLEYISGNDPIFTHQYSHAWFDFRNKRDAYTNYFENSVKATRAHKLFCLSLSREYPDYSQHLWGVTASDSAKGYAVWGGPPPLGSIDGSVVPCATCGSLPFLFEDCVRVLRTIRGAYGDRVWSRYGFVDAFNPLSSWYDSDVLGIDLGISMLMAENYRTGFVWQTFMKNREAQTAMQKAGFHTD